VFYAAGGGGGGWNTNVIAGLGGTSIAGDGGSAAGGNGGNALANYGSGGGGGGSTPSIAGNGGNGGSGIVIIRYPATQSAPTATTGNPQILYNDGYQCYIWTSSGTVTF